MTLTHSPNMTPEQALLALITGATFREAPVTREPRPLEAVIGIGKDNYAILAIYPEDLKALKAMGLEDTEARVTTVRSDLKDGNVIALESRRPLDAAGGASEEQLTEYAMQELAPTIELAKEGKIRAIAVAIETTDHRTCISYPTGNWEPGLVASVDLLKTRLLDQG